MKRLELYIPKLEDYWYEKRCLEDPETMSYNAGYDVSYYGYHYDTGCIDFPEERWKISFDKRVNENKYFAYFFLKNIVIIHTFIFDFPNIFNFNNFRQP